jgi:hypothetical protein
MDMMILHHQCAFDAYRCKIGCDRAATDQLLQCLVLMQASLRVLKLAMSLG